MDERAAIVNADYDAFSVSFVCYTDLGAEWQRFVRRRQRSLIEPFAAGRLSSVETWAVPTGLSAGRGGRLDSDYGN